jgi:hypothetical protein
MKMRKSQTAVGRDFNSSAAFEQLWLVRKAFGTVVLSRQWLPSDTTLLSLIFRAKI